MKSLERQLQTSLAIVLLLTLLSLVIIANLSTRNLLEEFVTSRIELDAVRLLDTLNMRSNKPKVRQGKINPIYSTSHSGHYYAIQFLPKKSSAPVLIFSPSLQGEELPLPESSQLKHGAAIVEHDMRGPDGQHLIVWSKAYKKDGQVVVISIAEDMSELMKNRQNFSILFISIGVVGFLLIWVLQRFVIRRLFKHLDGSRKEIKQIVSGERQQLSEDVPTEIFPLVREFNHSLLQMQQRMKRSRNSLGNLAHALKTPLSLLVQQLESGQTDLVYAQKQAERIRQLTERELKRARMAGLGNTTQRFDPREEIPTLIAVLKQAHQKQKLNVNYQIDDSISVFGDREDMLELLGNLLDNAYKWAESEVNCRIFIKQNSKVITIVIEDDGESADLQALKQIEQRGTRLDESKEGHGLGLAICKDIVALYSGSIRFEQSEKLGGFLVEVTI